MKLRYLAREDREHGLDVLTGAFRDYPVMRYVLADAGEEYPERLRRLMGFFADKRLLRGWPVVGLEAEGGLVGVALISPPGPAPPAEALERARDELSRLIGRPAFHRLERYEAESSRDQPPEPHHYLGLLAVRPDAQGRGHARPLLEEAHRMARSDPGSSGVCLSTETRDNIALYEHLGYRVIGERDVDGLHTWCMFRGNRP